MKNERRFWPFVLLTVALAASAACDSADSDTMLGADEPQDESTGALLFASVDLGDLEPGVNLAADPAKIRIDPCEPGAPVDPDTGKLLGKTTVGAFVRDADLQPVVGVNVIFSTSAGRLESMGQPVLTDEKGLATDTLAVDEDDAGEVVVDAVSEGFTGMLTLPVVLIPRPPVTLELSPDELWPPNHQLRDVTAMFGGVDCVPPFTIELVSVTSSEPDNGTGDGDTSGDIQGAEPGTADVHFRLRAERSGNGDGRVYTATYRVTDTEGVTSEISSTVLVPHDQGH